MDRVAIVGIGRMGGAVCARLVESGFEVIATDVLPARRADAEAAGARWADGLEGATPGRRDIAVVDAPLGGSPDDAREGGS